ncbi:hypothetical protein MLD52_04775 [Puniceicoccaceae bacterium K14]|nr:hypothetical protein [Puniceicoccaceae bacterium K14]
MDSFLSGREHLGEKPKAKEQLSLAPQPLDALQESDVDDSSELAEVCGESGTKVQYVSEAGRVVKILVTCNCGQVTEIDCKYEL